MGNNLRQEIAIATVISADNYSGNLTGLKKVYTFKGEGKTGSLQLYWLEARVAELVRGSSSNGMLEIVSLSCPAKPEQKVTVMLETYLPINELIILGGGHIALSLVTMGRLLGYRVAVVDDRHEFVVQERFPGADALICCNFSDIEKILTPGRGRSAIIITRGNEQDLECLRKLIKYPLDYLGIIGTKRKISMAWKKLIEENIDIKNINQVHMPSGLDIGAQTPEEIAVSIAAEMIKVSRRGGGTCTDMEGVPSAVDREVLQKTVKAAQHEVPAALATIIKTSGSTPRKAGARMLIYGGGDIWGTIGGGRGESEVRLAALGVIDEVKPRLHRVSMNAGPAALGGMSCGGTMEVFIEPVSAFKQIINGGEKFAPN